MPIFVSSICEGQPWLVDLGDCTTRAQRGLTASNTIDRLYKHSAVAHLFINITVTVRLPHYYLVKRARVRAGRDAGYIVSIHESACFGTDTNGLTRLVVRACAVALFDVAGQCGFDLDSMSTWLAGVGGLDRFEMS